MPTKIKLKLPYRAQENGYFCGPAVVQMVLAFYKVKTGQALLAKKMATTFKSGTTHKSLIKVFNSFGFKTAAQTNSGLSAIKKYLKLGVPIIVNYTSSEGIGHYAMVAGLTNTAIILNDPAYGHNYQLKIKNFLKSWHGYHLHVNRQWLLAILKK